ncbi:hypothetical protein QAD02_019841 [Eretmocerus hayati]|uniref:Uncharacterized protein n=1 Tax=Eretmocerus hayati TaxID=131215 RepID=A0ACC2PN89_9HYME|nr:hypothetical protein QAD02_019841 [Eretmocerus hayati]
MQTASMAWNPGFLSLAPPTSRSSSANGSAAAAAAAVVPQGAQQVSRPASVPVKVEYPPPAHSRSSKSTSSSSVSSGGSSNGGTPNSGNRHDKRDQQSAGVVQQSLPKAEPSVSLFGYSGYGQPGSGFAHEAAVKQMQSSKSSAAKDLRDQQQAHSLPNPPPLLSDHKSSVIVKNEGSSREQKQPAHSPSPKMMSYLNVQPVQVTGSQHKSAYEGRSPTQSPHGPSHHHQQQLLGSSPQPVHHASSRPGSAHLQHGPPGGVSRHSPHAPTSSGPPTSSSASLQQQHVVSQLPHPSPPEPRYLSRPEPQLGYPPHPAKSPYSPYPHPHHPHQPSASPTSHYAAPAASKPKVSSPAPPHIYGKPNSGILAGAPGAGITTGTPVCRASDSFSSSQSSTSSPSSIAGASVPLPLTSKASAASPFQSIGHHTVAPGSHFAAHPHPPPAHSSRSPYDSRGYNSPLGTASKLPPPPLHSNPGIGKLPPPMHLLPPGAALAPIARPPPGIAHPVAHLQPTQPQSQLGSSSSNVQTQPLDLGVERSGSPKRKACTPQGTCLDPSQQTVSLELTKRRRLDDTISPPHMQQQPTVSTVHNAIGSPMLSRVSEPSPLIASAATSINTVVNTALLTQPNSQSQMVSASVSPAPRTASGDGSLRPSSAGSVGSLPPMSSSSASANQFGSSTTVTTAATSTTPVPSPAPSTVASPAPVSAPGTPAKAEPVGNDKSASGSPAPPPRPPSSTSYPVHKLKKAWLQRHSGEDGTEDTTGVVGSGSCVTLPLNIAGSKQTNGNSGKDKDSNNSTSSTSSATSVSSSSTTTSTTSLPSAVNSIHNIGSMAVNSINKSKVAMKARKTPVKESMNGHVTSATGTQNNSESLHEDSSNSEPERKAPPKRKPPKVKRKKGATWKQQSIQEQQRQKKQKQVRGGAALGSDSSNESEAGSVSDSSEQRFPARAIMQIAAIDTYQTSGNGNKKVPKKRGRKPRTTKDIKTKEEEEEEEDYQPHQKKKRLESKTSGSSNKNKKRKNNRISTMEDKPEKEKLMKTLQSWIQDDLCHRYSCGRLSKCRECRLTPNQRDKMSPVRSVTVFCRFYAFRRMQYTKSGSLIMAGFNDPYVDADENDIQLWLPGKDNRFIKRDKYTEETQKDSKKDWDKGEFHIELAYQIIRQVGDQFCDLIHQEKKVVEEHLARDKDSKDQSLIWKRVVKEVREMCDLCDTTLFNYHWTCGKCGFVVCIDCYEARKNESMVWTESSKGRDKYGWLLCANRQTHVPEQLLLTQIIPADCLVQIDRHLHESRNEWGIPTHCSCKSVTTKQPNEYLVNLIKGDLVSVMNGNGEIVGTQMKKEKNSSDPCESDKVNGEQKNSPLHWLADVALQNQDKNDSDSDSDSDEDQDGNHSTLRELLIRPSHKANGSTSNPNSPEESNSVTDSNSPANTPSNNMSKTGKKSVMDTLNEVISSVIEHSVKKEDESERHGEKPTELKHFVRRYKCPQRGRDPLPIRIMTLLESTSLYPKVPHSWLCDGKLLRLHDPHDNNNYRIFQDQWRRGQPVLVSDVHKYLDKDLWHPDSFSKDFGIQKNDLVNCMTGNVVPKQPMWKFWEGFEHPSKRLKDEQGNAMLLKLKDWPSRGDFADILPTRFADLMKCVPLSEYTHRYGRLNLTSRLPDTFIKPDLGPKMYNAYGSALYPDKGTTNLHLDVSDAVNVMVYVGISKDGDREKHIDEALKAIDESGCDVLTRRRVRELGEVPGALWHIYHARDADKIRDMLNKVALENGARLEPHHDPIHDQSFYLDKSLRERLYRDYSVEGYAIVQCLGDAVFVPAGAPHQVRNLHNCIKVAEDFVSPENISHCFSLTQEFRALSDTHTNHEDKLQIKNIIYHAVKDSLTALDTFKDELLSKVKIEKPSSIAAITNTSFDSKTKIKVEKSDAT